MATESVGQYPGRLGPRGREEIGDAGQEVRVPAGRPVGHARDGALDGRARAVGRQQEQDGGQRPVAGPHGERRDGAADPLGGGRRGDAGGTVGPAEVAPGRPGPGHQAEQPVHEHGAGRSGEGAGRAREEHAQALADHPDPGQPEEGNDEGGAHGAPEQQADPDEELDQREEGVPDRDVGRHEVPDVCDEVPEDEGLPAGVGQDVVLDEALAEHEGLELQGGVEDPEQAQSDLEPPLRADGQREAAVVVVVFVLLRAPIGAHALVYATGGVGDGRVRAARRGRRGRRGCRGWRGQGNWKSWATQSVGVTASATGFPPTLS